MHDIEKELIKVTKFVPRKKYDDRQEYLKGILNALEKLSDADFEDLSDEATVWANAAVQAFNSRSEELPDFDEVAPGDEIEESDDEATDDVEEEGDDEAVVEAEADEGPVEDEPEPVKKSKKIAAKKEAPAPKKKPTFGRDEEDVILDKWGCMEGSKNSQALALFEKGATAKEVKDKIGGTYYNILGKAVENGHKLEKEGSLMKLIHKDDLGGKKVAPKKKK